MKVAILVPRRAGIPDRDRLWAFARTFWENDQPTWAIVEGHHTEGPFNRSAAINTAAAEAGDWDVAVIIDSDVLCDRDSVRAAVDVAAATNRIVLAYHERVHLSPRGTERVISGYRGDWRGPNMVAKTFVDSCSSCVVVSRKLWDQVGGFDEEFRGWGWEDVAFRCACETMSEAPLLKIASTIYHLHHRTSHENNEREPTFIANRERGHRYNAARWNRDAILELRGEIIRREPTTLPDPRLPRILHRTVPAETSEQVEAWWEHFIQLHPGWEMMTHRDPMDPAEWPETGDLWPLCRTGAQRAGLIRLEALYRWGGIYVDSDVEPYRSFEPLLALSGFAGWEDGKVVPDAVMGAEPKHPAVKAMIAKARHLVEIGADAWATGPGVLTSTLPGRGDWTLFPPGTFYPYHYNDKKRRGEDHMTQQPWAFCAHHWAASWVPT